MHSPRHVLCAIALSLAAGSFTAPAGADQDDAASAFDEGLRTFREGRYAEAAAAYERAAAKRAHPAALVNAAQAWELAGNFVRAVVACDRALTLSLDSALRSQVEARRARLLRNVGTLDVTGPAHFAVRVDGVEVLRPPARMRVSPGAHRLELVDESSKRTVEREVTVSASEEHHIVLSEHRIEVTIPVKSAPAPVRPEATRASEGSGPPLGTWVAFGVGAAAGATSGVFGFMTASARDDFDATPTEKNADTFERNRLVTNVALGVTVVAVATGVVLWLVAPRRVGTTSRAPGAVVTF